MGISSRTSRVSACWKNCSRFFKSVCSLASLMSASYCGFFQPVRLLPLLLVKHVEKRVRVVVIADPTGARDFVVEMRIRTQENFPLDLPQIHLNAQIVAPHLLQLDGDVLVDFGTAARRRVEHVFKSRKTFAAGIAGLGQQFTGERGIVAESRRRGVIRRPGREPASPPVFSPARVIFLTMRSLSIASASARRTRGSSNGFCVTLKRMK